VKIRFGGSNKELQIWKGQSLMHGDSDNRPAGSPKSREEHMARQAKHKTQKQVAKDHGVSQGTVSRKIGKTAIRHGFIGGGSAR
jgi:hypothetical protein